MKSEVGSFSLSDNGTDVDVWEFADLKKVVVEFKAMADAYNANYHAQQQVVPTTSYEPDYQASAETY